MLNSNLSSKPTDHNNVLFQSEHTKLNFDHSKKNYSP